MQSYRWRLFVPLAFLFLSAAALAQSSLDTGKKVSDSKSGKAGIAPVPGAQPFVDWSRRNAILLRTVEAGHGFDDMRPLGDVVGSARIVALGEATHGTREFFQLKHRMIEFLASQKGFTIFSIEANMPEAYRLNDFVLNGKGDPKELLKGMYFWTWNTQEVLDMILWMREFNQSGKGHIEFTGFDMQNPDVSLATVQAFVEQHDAANLVQIAKTYSDVRLERRGQRSRQAFGVATANFPVAAAAGKHIKYSGFIRTENMSRGWAGLWWRVDGSSKGMVFDNMQDRGPKGTTPWTRYEISLDVPADAKDIFFGIVHPGDGTAWFDSLKVEIDGVPYADSSKFDLDFESTSLQGFSTGGQGYEVALDKTFAHSGQQSLSSRFIGKPAATTPEGPTVDAKQLTQDCRKVVERLEAKRLELIKTVDPKDVDWAIQGARLVLQYMQLQTNEQSRDQSMAENVKWIADHNPGAKLVLWAHNGHVAYSGYRGYSPMGGYLHKMFGSQMVNFGFAFNQGSFQAVLMNKGLRDFTVGPAPEGSLDRSLAESGIPVLALDLRKLPQQGPVAQWLQEARATRTVGAVYSEDNAASYFMEMRPQEVFDAMLFVEKTTAARGNH